MHLAGDRPWQAKNIIHQLSWRNKSYACWCLSTFCIQLPCVIWGLCQGVVEAKFVKDCMIQKPQKVMRWFLFTSAGLGSGLGWLLLHSVDTAGLQNRVTCMCYQAILYWTGKPAKRIYLFTPLAHVRWFHFFADNTRSSSYYTAVSNGASW